MNRLWIAYRAFDPERLEEIEKWAKKYYPREWDQLLEKPDQPVQNFRILVDEIIKNRHRHLLV